MDQSIITKYQEIVDSLNGKYRFGYSQKNQLSFLTLKDGEISKVGGLIIDKPDLISIHSLDESLSFDHVAGMVVDDRLHLYEDIGDLPRYIHDVNQKFYSSDEDCKKDLEFLVMAEKLLFDEGLKQYLLHFNKDVIRI